MPLLIQSMTRPGTKGKESPRYGQPCHYLVYIEQVLVSPYASKIMPHCSREIAQTYDLNTGEPNFHDQVEKQC
jgi:hypothetical protein